MLGLANFLVYVILYSYFVGEAVNGNVRIIDGQVRYFLNPTPQDPMGQEVSRAVFIYSGIHSISIIPTVGAIILAMLTLAKQNLVSAMRSTIVRGRTFITILATVVTLIVIVWTIWFILQFSARLANPQDLRQPATQVSAWLRR